MPSATPTALVVDDAREVRARLVTVLVEQGITVRTAASCQEALTLLETATPPRVVLVELDLAGMTGQELLACLRAAGHRVPVVFMGYRATVEDEARRWGADGALGKPFDRDTVRRLVERFCAPPPRPAAIVSGPGMPRPHTRQSAPWTPAPLERNGATPLHQQITELIRHDIATGVLPVGAVLPPEPELARRWGVARGTLRLALRRLGYEGLLERMRGQGTRVCAAGRTSETAPLSRPTTTGLGDEVRRLQHQVTSLQAELDRRRRRRP